MSTTKLKEGIVGVDGASNQAVIQWFSRTSPGVDLNFWRPGFVLQDRTIVCWPMWLVAGNSEKGKILFLARSTYVQPRDLQRVIPQSIFICSYTSFHSSYTLASLCISSSYTACFYTT